ncbi:MAG TPA: hypothetical protein EYQ24_09555 [Bacteroidetes bacterium]|nr:hypothetical protein [Bacteroidota bacterium]HIL56763.1 hypothetical protein [Rhodothermales bacterium]
MPNRHPFVLALRDLFPEVKAAVDSYEIAGLLHCEVGEFARLSVEAFNAGDLDRVRRYFEFASGAFEGADAGLRNALHVSYAEAFAWGTPHEQTARALMPERLALAFDGMLAWPHPHPTDGAV